MTHQYIMCKFGLKAIHSFHIQGEDTLFSSIPRLCVTLKMGKCSQFLSMSLQYICASLVEIHPFLRERQDVDKPFSNILRLLVTLKRGSRSSNCNQFLSMSYQNIYACLVKIILFPLDTRRRQPIFRHSKTLCENEVKVTKF